MFGIFYIFFRIFDGTGGKPKTVDFPVKDRFTPATKEGSSELKGDRVIKLGTNM